MPLALLSDRWCAAARERWATAQAPPGTPDATISWRCPTTDLRWQVVIEGGALADLQPGEHPDPDLVVSVDAARWARALAGLEDGSDLLASTVVATDPAGPWRPPSPIDLGLDGTDAGLPELPGADLDVQYDYAAGPFGPVSFSLAFRSGRIAEQRLGPTADPDVVVGCTYLQMARVRRGELTIFDVLVAGGTVRGDEGPLALLGGISESPEFQAVERSCGPSGLVLAALGELAAAPGFATAARDLLDETDPPAP